MKKLLAITIVLGLAGAANAVISLQPSGGDLLYGETITISVVSDSSASYGGWLELQANGVGTFGSLVILPAAGADAAKDFSFDPWWTFEAKSFNPASPVVPGAHFTIDFTAGQVDGTAVLVLYEFDGATEIGRAAINVTPEPMTLALLGLGGLFLRRRS